MTENKILLVVLFFFFVSLHSNNSRTLALTTPLFTWDPLYVLGAPNFNTAPSSSATSPSVDTLYQPNSVCVQQDTIFVSDYGRNRVLAYSYPPSGNQTPINASLVLFASNFTVSGTQNAQVTTIRPFPDNTFTSSQTIQNSVMVAQFYAQSVGILSPPFSNGRNQSNFTLSTSGLSLSGVAYDPATSLLYVASTQQNQVYIYYYNSSTPSVAPQAIQAYGGSSSPPTSSSLNLPKNLKVDCRGGIWVADSANNRVIYFFNTMFAATIIGQPLSSTKNSSFTAKGLNSPNAIEFNSNCSIMWVADTGNSRVMQYRAPFTIGMSAEAALGTSSVNQTGSTAISNSTVVAPYDLFYDKYRGILWIADYGSNRVIGGKVDNGIGHVSPSPSSSVTPSISVSPSPLSASRSASSSISISSSLSPSVSLTVSISPTESLSPSNSPPNSVTPTVSATSGLTPSPITGNSDGSTAAASNSPSSANVLRSWRNLGWFQ